MLRNVKFGLILVAVVAGAAMSLAQGGGGGGRQGGRQGGRGNQNSLTALVTRADVQKDLGITDDQKTKVTELLAKMAEERRAAFAAGGGGNRGNGGGAGGGAPVDRAAMAKRAAEQEAKNRTALAGVLDAKQMMRLDEISIQRRANSAITDEKVQKALGLSDEQVSKIKDIKTKSDEANQSLNAKARAQEITREEATEARAKNAKVFDEELGKVLTAEQAAKLKEMGGKKFVEEKVQN